MNNPDFARLLRNSLVALLVCTALVWLCYVYVDRPVATYVYEQRFAKYVELKDMTYPPPLLQAYVPAVLTLLMIRRLWGPFRRWEWTLLVASISMIVADQFRESMAYVFGFTWPETWKDSNPSFIRDGVFGFHPFHGGQAYSSFPSGHMARTLAVAGVVWIAYPRWRWACILASLAVAVGLIGMNYHFVGEVIAGGFVGAIVASYMAHFGGLANKPGATVRPNGVQ